jgi:hypothetical protein
MQPTVVGLSDADFYLVESTKHVRGAAINWSNTIKQLMQIELDN